MVALPVSDTMFMIGTDYKMLNVLGAWRVSQIVLNIVPTFFLDLVYVFFTFYEENLRSNPERS